jgi:preprotein translocase subunit SecG
MKKFFIAICFLTTIFNTLAIMLGLCVAAKIKTVPGYIFSGVGALSIVALMVSARDAWTRGDAVHRCIRVFWCLALMVNIATVFLATGNHIILEMPLSNSASFNWNQVKDAELLQRLTIVVLTIFLTAAPIGVSYLWKSFYEDDEEHAEIPARKTAA